MWYRQESGDKYIAGVFKIFIFFAGFSVFFKTEVAFIFSIMVILILIAQGFYLKSVGKGLRLNNDKERKYYYREDKGEIILDFSNKGLPILSGTIKLFMDPIVEPINGQEMKLENIRHDKKGYMEISMPFSIGANQTMSMKVPFKATKRGLARVKKVDVIIPHPFGFGEVYLSYKYPIKKDVIIFPITRHVQNQLTFPTIKEGENIQVHSLHEDVLSPIGTRDYGLGDSFKRINWKASARKQVLQSKMFEKTSEHSVMLSFNVHEGYSITPELEQIIERMAYLAKTFSEKQISYGMAMNIRTFGQVPFLYIPTSSGRDHLFKVFEALALVDYQVVTIPYEKVMIQIEKQSGGLKNWIHFGNVNIRINQLFKAAAVKSTNLYQLSSSGDQLMPLQFHAKGDSVNG